MLSVKLVSLSVNLAGSFPGVCAYRNPFFPIKPCAHQRASYHPAPASQAVIVGKKLPVLFCQSRSGDKVVPTQLPPKGWFISAPGQPTAIRSSLVALRLDLVRLPRTLAALFRDAVPLRRNLVPLFLIPVAVRRSVIPLFRGVIRLFRGDNSLFRDAVRLPITPVCNNLRQNTRF